jgi:mRNA-degrading endonuclease toxin of MazEF toxin-antitoxin module
VITKDLVVVAMTSNPAPTPFSFMISNSDLISGKLNHSGKVRVDKIYALAQDTVVKIFGKVGNSVLDQIRQNLMD